jgi:hypothetical protein
MMPPAMTRDLCDSESVSIAPSGLAFGRLVPGTSRTRTATITYEGCGPASLELEVDGLFSVECTRGAFCLGETPNLELDPGESVPIEITFQPVNPGIALGGLLVSGCPTERCKAELLVQGSAQAAGVVCHPDPLDFGVVASGECASRRIDCTNVVDRPVQIERVASLEESSPDLAVSSDSNRQVMPDEVFGIEIDYCPADDGRDQGTLIVVSSVEGRSSSVAVALAARSGGGRLDMPQSIDFGQVSLIAPARRQLPVTNGGAYWLEVFGLEADPPFSVVLASGASLGPGQSANLWLQAEPISEGRVEGTIVLYSDDPSAPMRTVRATVEGINVPPCEISLSAEMIDFGAIPLGDQGSEELIVTNQSSLDCMLTNATVVEVNSAFQTADTRSMRIRPGSSASIAVKFTPSSTVTPSTATLEIGISSPSDPYRRVPLIGRGQ